MVFAISMQYQSPWEEELNLHIKNTCIIKYSNIKTKFYRIFFFGQIIIYSFINIIINLNRSEG